MKTEIIEKNGMGIMGEIKLNANKGNKRNMITNKYGMCRSAWKIRSLMLFFFTLLASVSVLAKEIEYKKVLTEGKRWEYEYDILCGSSEDVGGTKYSAEVIGDTMVNSKAAKKLLVKWEIPDQEWSKDMPKTGERVEVYIEENGKIYRQYDSGYTEEYMNMNYEENWIYMWCPIVYEDYIESPMGKLKRIFLNEIDDWQGIYRPLGMIEGVGASNTYVSPGSEIINGPFYRMTAFYYNDELLFTEDDFRIIPSGNLELELENNIDENAPYYDLMGQEVRNPVPGSIYIHQGRKIVYH